MIFAAGAAVGVILGFALGWWWRDSRPELVASDIVHVNSKGALLVDCRALTAAALAEIRTYQDEREAQYRTIRQRARHRQKRPIR